MKLSSQRPIRNHDQRTPTTRSPSPARNIVIGAVTAHLTQIQTNRAIENQFVAFVLRTQISNLLNYLLSLHSSNIYSAQMVHDIYCF